MGYVVLDEILATFDTPPTDEDKLVRLEDLIEVASTELEREVGFDFRAHGPETRVLDGYGGNRLHVHEGIVGTPAISFAGSYGGTLTLIAAGDLQLVAEDPASGAYDHVRLLGTTSGYGSFPRGNGLISVEATFGFGTVPEDVKAAVLDRARQLYAADPSLTGGVTGPGELGGASILPRWPHTFYMTLEHYRRRFAACWI